MNIELLVYLVPLLSIWAGWIIYAKRRSRRHLAVLEDNRRAGLNEPSTLHPVIDPAKCLGCGACARACPEQTVLGIIDGKAALIEPTMCVGHGACATACPTDAISLVFGTATRGVDIPLLSPDFETSVPGIFIAGELGGMGLIKNAVEQGRQAIESIAARTKRAKAETGMLDTVIVGCGPAGISASLGAIERKLSFITLDQSTLGGTVGHYPRGKVVMTSPAKLPLVGEMKFGEVSKERLLAFWQDVLTKTGLDPRFEEQVLEIERHADHFEVVTPNQRYRARTVLLATGRRGTPRQLGVPGEELGKVVYRFTDPEQYTGQRVLVVGGGDSALEAATTIAEQPGTKVTLSYRGSAFTRARAKNRNRLAMMVEKGRVSELLGSDIVAISTDHIDLLQGGRNLRIANDVVIICAGGILSTQFLHNAGIVVETKFGTT
jgi:thioredoxin reductase/ferredoxin